MFNKISQYIAKLRKDNNFSQDYLAKEIGVSRPTYMQIEKGARELTIPEAKILAGIFEMSLSDFIAGKDAVKPIVDIGSGKRGAKKATCEMRINVPQERAEKFEQVLLYILSKIGGRPNIGQTAIYKLLYFIDFDYYEKYEEQLIGARYMKNTHGPTPIMFAKIVDRMEKERKVEKIKSKFYKYEQTKYLVNPTLPLDLSSLSAQELAHIDWEIGRLGDLTATQMSGLSHIDTPWVVAGDREPLEYEHVFYRPEETSVRQYEEL